MLDFHLAHCIATYESKVSPTRTTLTSWSLELFACSINYSRLHSLASHCLWVVETNHSSQYSTSLLSLFHINYCIHLYIGITNCLWNGIKGFSLMDTSSTSEVKWEPTHQQLNNRLGIKMVFVAICPCFI